MQTGQVSQLQPLTSDTERALAMLEKCSELPFENSPNDIPRKLNLYNDGFLKAVGFMQDKNSSLRPHPLHDSFMTMSQYLLTGKKESKESASMQACPNLIKPTPFHSFRKKLQNSNNTLSPDFMILGKGGSCSMITALMRSETKVTALSPRQMSPINTMSPSKEEPNDDNKLQSDQEIKVTSESKYNSIEDAFIDKARKVIYRLKTGRCPRNREDHRTSHDQTKEEVEYMLRKVKRATNRVGQSEFKVAE